jgi:hypothetical protein
MAHVSEERTVARAGVPLPPTLVLGAGLVANQHLALRQTSENNRAPF